MKYLFLSSMIFLVSLTCISLGEQQTSQNFESKEFISKWALVEDFYALHLLKKPSLPISQMPNLNSSDTCIILNNNLNFMIDKNMFFERYNMLLEGVNVFFESDSDIIPFLLSYENNSADTLLSALYGLSSRHFESKQSGSVTFPTSYIDPSVFQSVIMRSSKYTALVLILNYCINQIYAPADIRLIFLNSIFDNDETSESRIDKEFLKLKQIYNRFYKTDLNQFYLEVTKAFGLQVDPYLESTATYTIKEPYKSMKDPDLIKIQEYFNKK